MDFDKLKETAQQHKIKIGFTRKGLYKSLAETMPDDAQIEMIAEGLSGANKAPIIVTADKVYIAVWGGMIGVDVATINRPNITSVSTSGGFLKTLSIDVQGKTYSVGSMAPPEAQAVARLLS